MLTGIAMVSIVFAPSVGGAQTHILRLSKALRQRGLDVLVVTRHHQGLARYEEVEGVPTYRVGRGDAGKAVAAASFMAGAVSVLRSQRASYDVLHCHQMLSPMTIGLMARAMVRKPLVINPHRSGPIGDVGVLTLRRPVTGRLRIAAARHWGDGFVCISDAIRAELGEQGVPAARLWDIPNGVDTAHFRPATPEKRARLRSQLGLPSGPLAVFAGRLVPEKGLDVLLSAWPQVLRHAPEAHLLIVGEGPERERLVEQSRRCGVAANVTFAPSQPDVAPYLRAADAFALPSYAEGLPIALLEAMACGLACVGTAVGGTTQLITSGETGWLVPPGDAPALAEALAEALVAPAAQRRAEAARERIVQEYSLDVVAERHIRMYEALAGGRTGRAVAHEAVPRSS